MRGNCASAFSGVPSELRLGGDEGKELKIVRMHFESNCFPLSVLDRRQKGR